MKKVSLATVLSIILLGSTFTGYATTISNYTTAVKGKIVSVSVYNKTREEWYDFTVNQEINSLGQTVSGQIDVNQLDPGSYTLIRYGHAPFQVQGKIILSGDPDGRDGTYVSTGQGVNFEKNSPVGWLRLPSYADDDQSIDETNEDSTLTIGDNTNVSTAVDNNWIEGYYEDGIDYEVTPIHFLVSENNGKKEAIGTYKSDILFNTKGLWSRVGWPGSKKYSSTLNTEFYTREDSAGLNQGEFRYIDGGNEEYYFWGKYDDTEYLFPPLLYKPQVELKK